MEKSIMILISLIAIIAFGLLLEKVIHPSYTLKEVVYQFKKDVKTVFTSFLTADMERHIFDITLRDELRNVVEPYRNEAFETEFARSSIQNVPTICVRFVPKKKFSKEALIELSNLLLIKFRGYLMLHNFNWQVFADFRSDEYYVYVNIHYAEYKEDYKNIILLYKQTIRQKSDVDYGVLIDDELNSELKNVS